MQVCAVLSDLMGRHDTDRGRSYSAAVQSQMLTATAPGGPVTAPGAADNARDRIRQAAIESFAYEGFDVGMRAIAARAGVTAGLITHYYRSKARLRQECDEYMLQYSSSRLPSSLASGSVEDTLTGDQEFLTQAVHYTIRSLREGGLFCDTFLTFTLENTRERIDAGIASGELQPSKDEDARARAVLRHCLGAALLDFALDPPRTPEETTTFLREFWTHLMEPMLQLTNGRSFRTVPGSGGYLERAGFATEK